MEKNGEYTEGGKCSMPGCKNRSTKLHSSGDSYVCTSCSSTSKAASMMKQAAVTLSDKHAR